tara:strand:+ start:69 stop:254 length:186 start_codon:yes stop_codon:yes gene_type:complete
MPSETRRFITIIHAARGIRVYRRGVMVEHIQPKEVPEDSAKLIKRLFTIYTDNKILPFRSS